MKHIKEFMANNYTGVLDMNYIKTAFRYLLRFFYNLSITKKLLIIYYIQIAVPLLLIGFLNYIVTSHLMYAKYQNYTADILSTIRIRIDDFITNMHLISQDLLYDDKIYNFMLEKESSSMLDEYEESMNIKNNLIKLIFSRPYIQSIAITTKGGKLISADNNREVVSIEDVIEHLNIQSLLFIEALKGNGQPVFKLAGKNGEYLFMIRAVYDRDNFSPIGMIAFLIDKQSLNLSFSDLIAEKNQNIFIYTSQKELITSKGQLPKNFESKLTKLTAKKDTILTKEIGNYIINTLKVNKADWSLVALISKNYLVKEAKDLRNLTIIFIFAAALAVSILTLFIAVDFLNPINKLVEAMKNVKNNNFKTKIENTRTDELGFLLNTFNEMVDKIDYLINSVYREQITRKESELKALQAQINPHFLFNTLESINWLAQMNNVPEISNAIYSLSKLLEASMGKGEKVITVLQELEYIDNFMNLMKMSLGEYLVFEKNIDSNALFVKIPKLIIEPIVENALLHGIKPKGSGKVTLTIYVENDMLNIYVVDDGVGIHEENLSYLTELISKDDVYNSIGPKYSNIGIINVTQRLKLFYNNNYTFEISSQYGEYTKVFIKIPIN